MAERHATHSPDAVLQYGEVPPQLESEKQPLWHLRSAVQLGADAGQSLLVMHCTHSPLLCAQTGAFFAQSLLVTHATHVFRCGSQSGYCVPAQSESATQAEHAPVLGSHCVPLEHITVLVGPHGGWHV